MSAPTTLNTDRKRPVNNGLSPPRDLGHDVENCLRRSGYLSLRDISCHVNGDTVRLSGRLPTYFLKQVAQAIVAEVQGVGLVVNQIEIVKHRSGSPVGRDGAEFADDAIGSR